MFIELVILLLCIFNLAASIIGYICLRDSGKIGSNKTNANFLIFNMVVSSMGILGSLFMMYNAVGSAPSAPKNIRMPNYPNVV